MQHAAMPELGAVPPADTESVQLVPGRDVSTGVLGHAGPQHGPGSRASVGPASRLAEGHGAPPVAMPGAARMRAAVPEGHAQQPSALHALAVAPACSSGAPQGGSAAQLTEPQASEECQASRMLPAVPHHRTHAAVSVGSQPGPQPPYARSMAAPNTAVLASDHRRMPVTAHGHNQAAVPSVGGGSGVRVAADLRPAADLAGGQTRVSHAPSVGTSEPNGRVPAPGSPLQMLQQHRPRHAAPAHRPMLAPPNLPAQLRPHAPHSGASHARPLATAAAVSGTSSHGPAFTPAAGMAAGAMPRHVSAPASACMAGPVAYYQRHAGAHEAGLQPPHSHGLQSAPVASHMMQAPLHAQHGGRMATSSAVPPAAASTGGVHAASAAEVASGCPWLGTPLPGHVPQACVPQQHGTAHGDARQHGTRLSVRGPIPAATGRLGQGAVSGAAAAGDRGMGPRDHVASAQCVAGAGVKATAGSAYVPRAAAGSAAVAAAGLIAPAHHVQQARVIGTSTLGGGGAFQPVASRGLGPQGPCRAAAHAPAPPSPGVQSPVASPVRGAQAMHTSGSPLGPRHDTTAGAAPPRCATPPVQLGKAAQPGIPGAERPDDDDVIVCDRAGAADPRAPVDRLRWAGPAPTAAANTAAECKRYMDSLPPGLHLMHTEEAAQVLCKAVHACSEIALAVHRPEQHAGEPCQVSCRMPALPGEPGYRGRRRRDAGATGETEAVAQYTTMAGVVFCWDLERAFYVCMDVKEVRTGRLRVRRHWQDVARALQQPVTKVMFAAKEIINLFRGLGCDPGGVAANVGALPPDGLAIHVAPPHADVRVLASLLHPGGAAVHDDAMILPRGSRPTKPHNDVSGPAEVLARKCSRMPGWDRDRFGQDLEHLPEGAPVLAAGQDPRLQESRLAEQLRVAREAMYALAVHRQVVPVVAALGMRAALERVEWPLTTVLADMEWSGMPVDPAAVEAQLAPLLKLQNDLAAEIRRVARQHGIADFTEPTASNRQVKELLWTRMKLTPPPDTEVRRCCSSGLGCSSAADRVGKGFRM